MATTSIKFFTQKDGTTEFIIPVDHPFYTRDPDKMDIPLEFGLINFFDFAGMRENRWVLQCTTKEPKRVASLIAAAGVFFAMKRERDSTQIKLDANTLEIARLEHRLKNGPIPEKIAVKTDDIIGGQPVEIIKVEKADNKLENNKAAFDWLIGESVKCLKWVGNSPDGQLITSKFSAYYITDDGITRVDLEPPLSLEKPVEEVAQEV